MPNPNINLPRVQILVDGIAILDERAQRHHADPTSGFTRLGAIWGSMVSTANNGTNITISGDLVALMLSAMKLHRACYSENDDNYVDAVNYVALAFEASKKGKLT